MAELRERQELDAAELLGRRRERRERREWAGDAEVLLYRCEVDSAIGLTFVSLDPDSRWAPKARSTCGSGAPRSVRTGATRHAISTAISASNAGSPWITRIARLTVNPP